MDNVGAPDTDEDVPRARAADILSGRFTLARMPDGAPGREWPLYAGWNLIGWQEEGK